MLEMELRQQFVAKAKTYYGCKEADGSHRKIIDLFNEIPGNLRGYTMRYEDPWCAAFVSAVGHACGLDRIILPSANCDAMIMKYRAINQWVENDAYVPKPGDLIMYDWQDSGAGDNTGSADHVGIVTEVIGNVLKVIEGNMSDSVGYRQMNINGKFIRGYCVPRFATEAAVKSAEITKPGKETATASQTEKTCKVMLPLLQRGSPEKKYVELLQWLLLREGLTCGGKWVNGREEPDGIFGDATYKSLLSYQIRAGLQADGKCGEESWGALI